jgi:hypothetical protein
MPLESATYITDLNISNPANSDGLNQADDHMRLIKSTLKSTFPNFTAAPLNSTQANIDGAATQFARNGDVPPGAMMDFATATAPQAGLSATALLCLGPPTLRCSQPSARLGALATEAPRLTSRLIAIVSDAILLV